uniref:activating signal cointegrator 1-like n=1 Tax=Styela clava TaxID=7725 RepID=UPI00193AB6C6|nr:activating signal cointegrator 1-like [Styela clava]
MATLAEWVYDEICKLLGPDTPRAYTDYILEIQDKNEVKEYLEQLCGEGKSPDIELFVNLLTAKRRAVQENVTVYKKGNSDLEQRSVRPKKKKEPKKVMTLDDISPATTPKTPLDAVASKNEKSPKKKTTYVSLYGKDGEARTNAVLLPGRNACECQAQKHKLINNCLGCGRVVCEQEGSGPCLFCGKMVCTPEEKKILARESNKSEKLLKKLSSIGGGASLTEDIEATKGLQRAEEYKNRLLEYDRTYVKRTKVIDDESDYYATDTNVWLSQKEREAMKKKDREMRELRFGSRLNKKVTLDFAGRKVIDEEYAPPQEGAEQEFLAQIADEKQAYDPSLQDAFPDLPMPKFIGKENKTPENVKFSSGSMKKQEKIQRHPLNRLQDKELQQMSDIGLCCSMHQAVGFLAVKGIKKTRGRNGKAVILLGWYSNHRGRLWIAAASHKPTPEEVKQIEDRHRNYVDNDVVFPTEYPTSCLLGCVNVDNVMSQEEYRSAYPNGASGSPYVFVCSGFEELLVKVPVTGQHKIWKLPPNLHQAAKKGRTIMHGDF